MGLVRDTGSERVGIETRRNSFYLTSYVPGHIFSYSNDHIEITYVFMAELLAILRDQPEIMGEKLKQIEEEFLCPQEPESNDR